VVFVGSQGSLSSYAPGHFVSNNTILSKGGGPGVVTAANYAGPVGSECDILASTALGSSATVTEAWRSRNNYENHVAFGQGSEQLPSGVQWLTSDVVDIEGVPNNVAFAMQMTFEDGINSYVEPSQTTSVSNAYIAKLVGNQWKTPSQYTTSGGSAVQAYAGSLADFLTQYYNGSNLAALAGSWGADLSNPGGLETSWVILSTAASGATGGQFAVVPEPSTFVLLGAGVVGLFAYRVRRKRGNKFYKV
jgi:hypothetical protein